MADRSRAVNRLSRATLDEARRVDVDLPSTAVTGAPVGIVHLGIGAFHRAHQAAYTQEAMAASGDATWGICGVTQRSASVREQLAPQDGLYGVLVSAPKRTRLQVVGAVRQVLFPAEQQAELDARFADEGVALVTLTVTEKGYRRDGAGRLDHTDAAVAADLAGGTPRSAVGRLVRGLQHRATTSGAPITVLSCDNLTSNGEVLHRLVDDFCAALPNAEGEPLRAWIDEHVTFPCSMVDRIVPATTEADRAHAAELLGLRDEGLVVAEPFTQWVIEDSFATRRPAWDQVGAEFTDDVAPYELMKLRILNGSHSTLAYLGALAGKETIAETVAEPSLLEAARALITDDVIPTLTPPGATDLAAYGETVVERYANPALAHRTVQIAMDGSQKLPLRLLGTVRDALGAGRFPAHALRGVAAWMTYVACERDVTGRPLPLDDPMADRLGAVRGDAEAASVVDRLLAIEEIFGADLPDAPGVREHLTDQVGELLARTRGVPGR